MRSKLYTLLFVMHVSVITPSINAQVINTCHQSINNLPAKKEEQLPEGASSDWYGQAVAGIQQLQQQFYAAAAEGNFRVANTTHKLNFHIHPGGYTVSGMQDSQRSAWKVSFQLKGIGRDALQWTPSENFSISQSANQLSYRYDDVRVDYLNNEDGLRQNFIVHKKMAGKGLLAVNIALYGDLMAGLTEENQLAFYAPDDADNILLTYEDLKVWDARQKVLPASMRLQKGRLIIEVDDRNAAYPITIDPLNKTPEWSTSANGVITATLTQTQLNAALYGYSVCGLGDVNGDGYGDVAISAPSLIDVFSGTGTLAGVGAVFVYYGSVNGLSTTPAKTLQPNTAVAGALFGYSLDAGDVTGDGINDIIIGAPLDRYQTTARGLLGPVSANVKAGKVYIYPGGSNASPNPTNFLEVKLEGTGFFSTGILGLLLSNVNVNALFGFSVAATNDLNGDGRADLLVGSPAYVNIDVASVQNGSAFIFYSDNLNTTTPVQLETPAPSLLGLVQLPVLNASGLLFGFSVDGLGDYNSDGYPDVVVGAPAGVDLSSLGGVLTGQVLGGSAYIYYGTGTGVSSSIGARLQPAASGLLGNAANLFGYKVKGAKSASGVRTGGVLVGAPVGGLVPNLLGLTIQTGNVHLFKRKSSSPVAPVTGDQVLESPRSTSLLQVLNSLDLNVLFGAAIDNAYDVNCDGRADLVIGEPLGSGASLLQLQANAIGGSAYVYLGDGLGGYLPTPGYNAATSYGSDFLSVNATSLFGFSVAGAPAVRGSGSATRILVGSPAGALDFDNSLLNLGSTLGLVLDFAVGDNGPGKSYVFNTNLCIDIPLPLTLLEFKGHQQNKMIDLGWKTSHEVNVSHFEVQRSTDGVHCETIGLVFSNDNSTGDHYQFTDKSPFPGVNYYRLNMVDKDQTQEYSQLISFRLGAGGNGNIAISPNPAVSNIRIQFNGVNNSNYRIELRNTAGQLILNKSVNVTRYGQSENLIRPVSMAPGLYFIMIFDKNNKLTTSDKILIH